MILYSQERLAIDNNNTKNYTSYTTLSYSIVLVQMRSLFTIPCSEHSKIAYTNPCNWTVPFVPSMPSDHGSETFVYETTTLPLYPKKPERFPQSLPLRGMAHLALNLTFSQHKLSSVRTPFLDRDAASCRSNCSNPRHTRWWGHLVDLPPKN